MITKDKLRQLGDALADIYRQYPTEDLEKILDYALENRQMLGYPHEVAEMLERFAKKLRAFPDNRDPTAERWKKEMENKKR
jgi:hypothetical protein